MTRWLIPAAAMLVGAARAGAQTLAVDSPRPPLPVLAALQARLSPDAIHYGPSVGRYLIHRRLRVVQSYEGHPQTQDLGARLFVSTVISGPADSAGYPATFIIDSILPDSGLPPPVAEDISKVRAVAFAGRLGPVGEFRSAAVAEGGLSHNVAQLVGGFRDFLPRIPAAGVHLGATWTDTLSVTQRAGGTEMRRHIVLHSTAAAWEVHAGSRSLRIESTTTYRTEGSGLNGGQAFEINGTGTSSARAFLAEDGRFVGGETQDSASLVITLPMQQLNIPVTQLLQSSVVTLP